MIFVKFYGVTFRVKPEKFKKMLELISEEIEFYVRDFGERWEEPIVGEIVDIGRMTKEQASEHLLALSRFQEVS